MRNKITGFLAFLALVLPACKKSGTDDISLTSEIIIVNAAVGIPAVKVNVTGPGFIYLSAPQINYSAAAIYFTPRAIVPVKMVATVDTTIFLVNSSLNLQSGIHTMFLIGQAPKPDTLFRQETDYPFMRTDRIYTKADSMVNVRFINLSPNSTPLKIKIATSASNEIDNLPYKSLSPWKSYPALLSSTNYSFQVRDAGTDALLTTFSFNATSTNRFKNVTLVIKGLQGTTTGANAFGVFAVNYF